MKTIERSILYALLALVVILYILQFRGSSTEGEISDEDSTATVVSDVKHGLIYFVNTDSIWSKYNYVKDAMDDMQARKKNYEGRLESKYREYEKDYTDFQQNGASMTQIEQQLKQRDLMRKESELGKLREELETKIMQEEKQWNDELREKIIAYIDSHTVNRQYDYILGYSIQSNIILANDSLDLTKDVIRGLNEQYDKTKKTK